MRLTTSEDYAVIVHYDVTSDRQQTLHQQLSEEIRQWIAHRPGFIKSELRSSLDGLNVMVHLCWENKDAATTYMDCPEAQHLWEVIRECQARQRNATNYGAADCLSP